MKPAFTISFQLFSKSRKKNLLLLLFANLAIFQGKPSHQKARLLGILISQVSVGLNPI